MLRVSTLILAFLPLFAPVSAHAARAHDVNVTVLSTMLVGNAKTGNVEIGGLMLCKMPAEMSKARDEYYEAQTRAQLQSVDNHFMRNEDPRMPLFSDRSTDVTRGRRFGSGS